MAIYLLAFLIGLTTGLRTLAPLAIVSWGAHLGWLHLEHTWLSFLGATVTPWILSLFALGELVTDKLPTTPSRKTPMQFGARLGIGALSGAALAAPASAGIAGLVAGVIGAIVGTLGGAELRGRFTRAAGNDLPIALFEDAVAIGCSLLIVSRCA